MESGFLRLHRAHAGDGERFLEDDLAGEFRQHRHGYQLGGSGQGEALSFFFCAPKTGDTKAILANGQFALKVYCLFGLQK